jgi:hypothetical protein
MNMLCGGLRGQREEAVLVRSNVDGGAGRMTETSVEFIAQLKH